MNIIYRHDGVVLQRSKNLLGIRRYVNKGGPYRTENPIEYIDISPAPEGEGELFIQFKDRAYYRTTFACLGVLIDWMLRWQKVRGEPLRIKGVPAGELTKDNPELQKLRERKATLEDLQA